MRNITLSRRTHCHGLKRKAEPFYTSAFKVFSNEPGYYHPGLHQSTCNSSALQPSKCSQTNQNQATTKDLHDRLFHSGSRPKLMLVSTSTPSERSKLHMWHRLSRKSKHMEPFCTLQSSKFSDGPSYYSQRSAPDASLRLATSTDTQQRMLRSSNSGYNLEKNSEKNCIFRTLLQRRNFQELTIFPCMRHCIRTIWVHPWQRRSGKEGTACIHLLLLQQRSLWLLGVGLQLMMSGRSAGLLALALLQLMMSGRNARLLALALVATLRTRCRGLLSCLFLQSCLHHPDF